MGSGSPASGQCGRPANRFPGADACLLQSRGLMVLTRAAPQDTLEVPLQPARRNAELIGQAGHHEWSVAVLADQIGRRWISRIAAFSIAVDWRLAITPVGGISTGPARGGRT